MSTVTRVQILNIISGLFIFYIYSGKKCGMPSFWFIFSILFLPFLKAIMLTILASRWLVDALLRPHSSCFKKAAVKLCQRANKCADNKLSRSVRVCHFVNSLDVPCVGWDFRARFWFLSTLIGDSRRHLLEKLLWRAPYLLCQKFSRMLVSHAAMTDQLLLQSGANVLSELTRNRHKRIRSGRRCQHR